MTRIAVGSRRRSAVRVMLVMALGVPATLLWGVGVSEGRVHSQLGPPPGPISWISTGDSYASGEGIAGTGLGADVCAQSRQAFGPAAADLLRFTRAWTIEPEGFSACTGAVIPDVFGAGGPNGGLWQWGLTQASPPEGRFDVITISIGGNDVYFSKVILDCLGFPDSFADVFRDGLLGDRCDTEISADLETRIEALKPDLQGLFTTLIDDHLTANGVLVVAGYPRLFTPSKDWGAWRGDRCQFVQRDDADRLGNAAVRFDQVTHDALTTADAGRKRVHYLSRLALFDQRGSHALCGHAAEWLNGVSLGIHDGTGRREHSFHPNELGHAATAAALATTLSRRMGTRIETPEVTAAPTAPSTTEPPIAPTSSYDIGDDFDAQCVVAWPTAPVRYRDHIEMRMSCSGVPSQFLFVDIGYEDPDLPITPSTGTIRVRGEIIDIARSELGFTTLIVLADKIDL